MGTSTLRVPEGTRSASYVNSLHLSRNLPALFPQKATTSECPSKSHKVIEVGLVLAITKSNQYSCGTHAVSIR